MIDLIYKLVLYYIRKNKFGGSPSDIEFNNLCEVEQLNIIKRSVKNKGNEIYSIINDEISHIKEKTIINVSGGDFDKPTDLLYLLGLESLNIIDGITTTYDIDVISTNEFNYRKQSSIVNADISFPIANSFASSWAVLPDTISQVNCTYLKIPPKPVWEYTIINSRKVYDAGSSTDFTLPESMITEIAMGILQQMGINVRENQIIEYANQIQKENE